jgi:DNA-binding beta-propeller fold protein YncE
MRELAALALSLLAGLPAYAAEQQPLQLVAKIPLGKVSGRIDHLAVDLPRQRLFVAELGNDTVGVVDLKDGKTISRIGGLREPQGVGYMPSTDTLYVANAADGAVHLFHGSQLVPAGRIELGDDADNVRVDAKENRVFVGYGRGALAIIDPTGPTKIGGIELPAHPEGFQLESSGGRIFVNLPDARQVAVIDRSTAKIGATWPLRDIGANFPIAIDETEQLVLIVARSPAKLVALGRDGSVTAKVDTCRDADDVFVDPRRRRVYVSCGEGLVDVFERRDGGYERIARIPTVHGARTSYYSTALDRLFVAVRAAFGEPAAIWVFEPTP